jgi:Uma2 family endonuclease
MALHLEKRLFTVDEYHKMAEAGILNEDDRVELIEGEIVKMSPIGVSHMACVNRLTVILVELLRRRAIVSVQNPINLYDHTELQPDVALLKFREDFYADKPPAATDTLLIIEVSDSTISDDQRYKVPKYARAGIPEAWLVNICKQVIEAYSSLHNGAYQQRRRAQRGATLVTPGFPDVTLTVNDILG